MFDISIEIDRPAQTVFRHIEDIEAAPAWYSAVQSVAKLTTGPVGRGSRYRFSRNLAGRVVENIVEVTEFEVDALLTLSCLSGPTPFTYRFRLAPTGHKTHLHLEGSITGKGLPGPMALLALPASSFFERGMRTNLESLKRIVGTARPAE
ncbi:SRPBCC family protein [Mesorhizobium sp. M1403]|uniref:SRPBCC family protein n=1 Tax=Mesorhizobium sp. M1403 TaxID=2957097 RepID=UPI0033387E89